jgi:hypothetical protein
MQPWRLRIELDEVCETLGERRILRTEAVDLWTIDGKGDTVGQRAHTRSAEPIGRQERALPEDCARTKLSRAFRRLHDELSLHHDEQARPRLAALDQHLAGPERKLGATLLQPAQIVLVHDPSIASGSGDDAVTELELPIRRS